MSAGKMVNSDQNPNRKKLYAVVKGKTTVIYNSWSECAANIRKVFGSQYRAFKTYD